MWASLVGAVPSGGETLDRVVASIGNVAITRSEVEEEFRFEKFLEGEVPLTPPDEGTLARVRDRLIEQKLLAEESAAEGNDPADPPARTPEALDEVRRKFGSEEAFQSARHALGMDEREILDRMAEQQSTLRSIEQRFRPSAWPEQAEIEAYYRETFVPQFTRQSNLPAPPLNELEGKIREILVEKKINDLLETWLGEMKSSHRVKVHAF